jgi:8-oxo-dGTP pyrophosphatase MutT (NUDIX family)
VSALRPSAAWRARLQAAADCPPLRPRVPFWWRGQRIGSVEPDLFERAALTGGDLLRRCVQQGESGWELQGELTPAIARLACALRDAGLAHTWRNEQLAVCTPEGQVLGSVERGVVRPLGIATHAVHLVGLDPLGRHWVQQRAFDKPTDPGKWDTLVGGMVPAGEPTALALERETWEEAGLRLRDLQGLRHGGRLLTRRPFGELAHGYVVETIDWFACTLPAELAPRNQDGEVAAFDCMAAVEVSALLEQDAFTIDAALILLDAFGAPAPAPRGR